VEEGGMGEEVEREDGGCTRKRERAESKGHGPAQSPLGPAFDCQPTLWLLTCLAGFTFGSLPRARARSFISPSALSSLIVSAHTAPSVIPYSICSAPSTSPALRRLASNPDGGAPPPRHAQ
jgi:hypothetical protein